MATSLYTATVSGIPPRPRALPSYRARIFGLTHIAPLLSSVAGAPLSTWLLTSMDGVAGLKGWQWMFVIDRLPALVMRVVLFVWLPSRPEDACFLSSEEKAVLTGLISRERAGRERVERFTVWQAMTDGRVWAMCMIALGLVIGTTGVAIWMPQLIKQFGLTTMQVGFVAAIPSFMAVFATLFAGWNADRTGARVAHVVVPFLCTACGFVLAALTATGRACTRQPRAATFRCGAACKVP